MIEKSHLFVYFKTFSTHHGLSSVRHSSVVSQHPRVKWNGFQYLLIFFLFLLSCAVLLIISYFLLLLLLTFQLLYLFTMFSRLVTVFPLDLELLLDRVNFPEMPMTLFYCYFSTFHPFHTHSHI